MVNSLFFFRTLLTISSWYSGLGDRMIVFSSIFYIKMVLHETLDSFE